MPQFAPEVETEAEQLGVLALERLARVHIMQNTMVGRGNGNRQSAQTQCMLMHLMTGEKKIKNLDLGGYKL